MHVKQKVDIHNRFDVFVKNAKTGEEKQVAYAENVILNQFWTTWFASTSTATASPWAYYIRIGTGTGEISPSRTGMFTQLAQIQAGSPATAWNEAEKVFSRRVQVTITEAQYVGAAITEIGLASSLCQCTHALLRDMNGNPVSIAKTDVDIITFYATVYLKYNNTALKQSRVIGSNLRDLLTGASTPSGFTTCSGALSGIKSPVYSTYEKEFNSSVSFTMTRNTSLKKLVSNTVRIAPGTANISGLRALYLSSYGLWIDLTDEDYYDGSEIIGEQVGVGDGTQKDFATAFDFVKEGAVVKVDGVADGTATVDYNVPVNREATRFLDLISTTHDDWFFGKSLHTQTVPIGNKCVYENTYAGRCPIKYITAHTNSPGNIYEFSDDLENWTSQTATGTVTISEANGAKRYIRITVGNSFCKIANGLTEAIIPNIHFDTAPAEGAVITIDYETPVIAKDSNHVLDISFELQLGEYTPE